MVIWVQVHSWSSQAYSGVLLTENGYSFIQRLRLSRGSYVQKLFESCLKLAIMLP